MESSMEERHTCLKLELSQDATTIFVMGTWFPCRFSLSITDGLNSWICDASEEDVKERASQWDQSVPEYIQFAESYLGFQQPASVYRFADAAGNGHRRLSWTFEKEGTTLEWRWRCKPSPNPKNTTATILDFLMASNIRLSDELVQRDDLNKQLQLEANKCLLQSEMLSAERHEFQSQLYSKFVSVLNSKKAKLRKLRDQLSKQEARGKLPQEGDVSTDGTEPYHSETDHGVTSEEKSDGETSTSPTIPRSRKRNTST